MPFPPLVPLYPAGHEPLPPGMTEEDREGLEKLRKTEKYMQMAMESCIVKSTLSGGAGFGIGAFFSLMSSSFAYEDPLLRPNQVGLNTRQKTAEVFKEMGRGMWRSGKGFGKVGALYAGIECVIEGYRARNDMTNAVAAGFVAGGILGRASGPKGALGAAAAFAAFSTAIELFLRRESSDDE